MLAQPLIITALVCAVCRDLTTIDFLLVISAMWFGCSGAAQQIVKERPIYRRERMVSGKETKTVRAGSLNISRSAFADWLKGIFRREFGSERMVRT